MPTKTWTPEKTAKVHEARDARRSALDMLDLGLAHGKLTREEVAQWMDLIFRCRSLADITKLKDMVSTMTGLNL